MEKIGVGEPRDWNSLDCAVIQRHVLPEGPTA